MASSVILACRDSFFELLWFIKHRSPVGEKLTNLGIEYIRIIVAYDFKPIAYHGHQLHKQLRTVDGRCRCSSHSWEDLGRSLYTFYQNAS